MKNIHIENSYKIWLPQTMRILIDNRYAEITGDSTRNITDKWLNRSYRGMYIEWYLHNILYYITLPFCDSVKLAEYNARAKHVDLEEH